MRDERERTPTNVYVRIYFTRCGTGGIFLEAVREPCRRRRCRHGSADAQKKLLTGNSALAVSASAFVSSLSSFSMSARRQRLDNLFFFFGFPRRCTRMATARLRDV